jgi:hypothetical protein
MSAGAGVVELCLEAENGFPKGLKRSDWVNRFARDLSDRDARLWRRKRLDRGAAGVAGQSRSA